MHPIYLPNATKLSDIFTEIHSNNTNKMGGTWRNREAGFTGPVFCNFQDNNSLLVVPTKEVINVVADAQAIVPDNNVYFSMIPRDDNTVLILMQYNKIIGSRWLCILPMSEVEFLKEIK